MPIRCQAIVEKGLLRPLRDFGLKDADRVSLIVERVGEEAGLPQAEPAQLAAAAQALLADYTAGGELTAFTVLDGEDIRAEG